MSNTINNIGILVKDGNNKGVKIKKGVIKDEENNIIRQFTTNDLGMNSVRLFFKRKQQYTFYATLFNGSEIKVTTNKPINEGIVLKVNTKDAKYIVININTNSETLEKIADKEYKIMIHNTRNFNNHSFKFERGKKKYVLLIEKNNLPFSINIITLFNDNNIPISERIIFNHSDNLLGKVNINSKKIKNDSIEVEISNNSIEKIYASASFLPIRSKAYNPRNNIISSLLFNPYIKGHIPNISNLLNNYNLKNQRKIDLLLLTQGWSKYNWKNIFDVKSKIFFKFENGIDLTLKINKNLTKKQSLLVYSEDNNFVRILNKEQIPWVLKNSFIKKNSNIRFSLKSNDNFYKISPVLSYSNALLTEKLNINKIFNTSNSKKTSISNFKFLNDEFETLNEVEVKSNKRNKLENTDNVYGGMTMLTGKKMENLLINSGETILDFIRSKGYVVIDNGGVSISPRGVNFSRSQLSFNSDEEDDPEISFRGRPLMRVFLDGMDISQNLEVLRSVYLNTVKEVFYGRDPQTIGEKIHIFLLSPSEYNEKNDEYKHTKFPIGFATEKEYYNPKYPSFTNDTYTKYGAIHWNPNILILPYSKINFKVPKNMQKKINIYLEGISESGKVISKKKHSK